MLSSGAQHLTLRVEVEQGASDALDELEDYRNEGHHFGGTYNPGAPLGRVQIVVSSSCQYLSHRLKVEIELFNGALLCDSHYQCRFVLFAFC